MKRTVAVLALALPMLAAGPPLDKAKALGSPTAPVVLEVFSDFQCPQCRLFHRDTLPLLMRDYVVKGKVYIVAREFPLNIPAHVYSRQAAAYVTAAARIGMYGPVADAIFAAQESWDKTGKLWESFASTLNAEQQKRVQALAKDATVLKAVQDDVNYGESLGINGTPTVNLIRGAKHFTLTGYQLTYTLLKSLIDDMAK